MPRPSQSPRYIKPEVICIGDLIRVTVQNKDTEVSTVGRVARREINNYYTEYLTTDGVTLLEHMRYHPEKVVVTLLDRKEDNNVIQLFDMV